MLRFRTFLLGLLVAAAAPEARGREPALPAEAVEVVWPHLGSPERAIREAARLAIEAQPFDSWKERALAETNTAAALEALLALVRACPKAQAAAIAPHVCEGITTLRIEQMSEEQRLAAIRLSRLVLTRLGPPTDDERRQMTDLWMHFFPPSDATPEVARELCQLLILLDAPGVVEKTLNFLRAAPTAERRAEYFAWLTASAPESETDPPLRNRLEKIQQEARAALDAAGGR